MVFYLSPSLLSDTQPPSSRIHPPPCFLFFFKMIYEARLRKNVRNSVWTLVKILFFSLPLFLSCSSTFSFFFLSSCGNLSSRRRETIIKVAQDSGDIRSRLSIILGQWRSTIRNNVFVSVRANSSRLLFVNVRCKVIFLLAVNLVNQSLRIYVDDDQSWYKNRTIFG